MRFMLLMIPDGYEKAPAHAAPDAAAVESMMRYNDSMRQAGILLGLDGLHPPSTGARVRFSGGTPTVTDGPFIETREALGGFWMIDVPSQADAVAWAERCPVDHGATIEVRRVFEISDFPPEAQAAARKFPELNAEMARRAGGRGAAGTAEGR